MKMRLLSIPLTKEDPIKSTETAVHGGFPTFHLSSGKSPIFLFNNTRRLILQI